MTHSAADPASGFVTTGPPAARPRTPRCSLRRTAPASGPCRPNAGPRRCSGPGGAATRRTWHSPRSLHPRSQQGLPHGLTSGAPPSATARSATSSPSARQASTRSSSSRCTDRKCGPSTFQCACLPMRARSTRRPPYLLGASCSPATGPEGARSRRCAEAHRLPSWRPQGVDMTVSSRIDPPRPSTATTCTVADMAT
jgi:hypothetical protein